MQTLSLTKIVVSILVVTLIAVPQTPPAAKDPPLLSATDPGYAFVEDIQKTYCNKKPSHNCRFDLAQCKQTIAKLWLELFGESATPEILKKSCDRVSTEFELPGVYSLLRDLYSEVREVAPQVGLPQLDRVHLGSLPIRDVNARVLPPDPALGHFLFFNIRFFEFANELAKVAALSIPMKVENNLLVIEGSREALEKKLAGDNEIRFLFINRLLHFLEVESLKPAPPPRDIQPILLRYQQGIELFAMAHEYSHIALKHAGATKALEGMDLPTSALGISGPSSDWAQELEADFYAAKIFKKISMRRLSVRDPHMAEYMLIATPEFYFLARQILNEAHAIFFNDRQVNTQSGEELRLLKVAIDCTRNIECHLADVLSKQVGIPKKHPNSTIRREFARVLLEDNDNSRDETKQAMNALASQMIRNIDYLWNNVSTKLRSPEAAGLIQQVRDKRAKLQ
jgi:hypothetical protein